MAESPDNCVLLTMVASGDQDALHQLYQRFRVRLWHYIWPQLGSNVDLAEETLQDTFIAIWNSARHFRGDAQVATWIFQIAHYRVVDALRRQARRRGEVTMTLTDDRQIVDQAMASDTWEDTVIDRLILSDNLRHLSPKHQEVLELVFAQGFSIEEVASILAIPPGTVKSRVSYARQALLKLCKTPAGGANTHDR
jgi:RNA polymerase sigma-70 factor, ECF subfamily